MHKIQKNILCYIYMTYNLFDICHIRFASQKTRRHLIKIGFKTTVEILIFVWSTTKKKHNQNKKNNKPCMYEMSCILLKFKNIKKKIYAIHTFCELGQLIFNKRLVNSILSIKFHKCKFKKCLFSFNIYFNFKSTILFALPN